MESNNLAMVKNTGSWALKEEEIELDLGLSVGGSYSRQNGAGLKSDKSIDSGPDFIRSSISSSFDATEEKDQTTKREIHALRRQEAKKKREEKQLKRGICKPNFNGGQSEERECKKFRKEENGSDHKIDEISDMNHKIGSCYAAPCNPSPAQYATSPGNGFMYPCANVMPCWFAGGAAPTEEKHMVQVLPVVGYGFVPPLDLDHSSGNGYGSEENCSGGDRGNRKSGSNGSTNCTSSTGSDHRCSCNEGGGSSNNYTRSHSSPSVPQQPQMNRSKANDAKSHSEHTAISNLSESASVNEAITTNTTSNSTLTEIKNKSGTENKPKTPKLVVPQEQTTPPPLPYMPCVSTTGNGPNGKTVNGFLYRYTKTEVSIICVCHGSSFSPAEFVQHAGGTDVLHPLRHITVVPSAF